MPGRPRLQPAARRRGRGRRRPFAARLPAASRPELRAGAADRRGRRRGRRARALEPRRASRWPRAIGPPARRRRPASLQRRRPPRRRALPAASGARLRVDRRDRTLGARDGAVHRGARRAERRTVANDEHRRVEIAQRPSRLDDLGLVPGCRRGEGEPQIEMLGPAPAAPARKQWRAQGSVASERNGVPEARPAGLSLPRAEQAASPSCS